MFDVGLVDWSRAQFALTAMYHWLFVPFTLWVTYIIAVMFTIYYKTWSDFWKKLTHFWTKIFAVNFAIWVATWIILEFEFGTNWSNYSWFVWDIFWAPLVVEWLSAFFLETTFLAVLLLWWGKVSKWFHLFSAWMIAIWWTLSATWILIANWWMQHPTWMTFNPDTMRNEMVNIGDVIFNPVWLLKIWHVLSQALVLASVVIIWISAWYLLKKREKEFAYKSIKIASIFWIIFSICTVITWDLSWKEVAKMQPMKVAVIEWLYEGWTSAEFLPVAFFWEEKQDGMRDILWSIEMPGVLSLLLHWNTSAYVPWIKELIYWNSEHGIVSAESRINNWKIAIESLKNYKKYKTEWNESLASLELDRFRQYEKDFWYWYFDINKLGELVPPVPFLFWSFRYMVALGFFLMIFFPFMYYMAKTRKLEKYRKVMLWSLFLIPLVYLWSELWWAVAEVGRQPWIVYEVLPTKVWLSASSETIVKTIFFLFLTVFTVLLIAALKIAIALIKEWPKIEESWINEEKVVSPKTRAIRQVTSRKTTPKVVDMSEKKAKTPTVKKTAIKTTVVKVEKEVKPTKLAPTRKTKVVVEQTKEKPIKKSVEKSTKESKSGSIVAEKKEQKTTKAKSSVKKVEKKEQKKEVSTKKKTTSKAKTEKKK